VIAATALDAVVSAMINAKKAAKGLTRENIAVLYLSGEIWGDFSAAKCQTPLDHLLPCACGLRNGGSGSLLQSRTID